VKNTALSCKKNSSWGKDKRSPAPKQSGPKRTEHGSTKCHNKQKRGPLQGSTCFLLGTAFAPEMGKKGCLHSKSAEPSDGTNRNGPPFLQRKKTPMANTKRNQMSDRSNLDKFQVLPHLRIQRKLKSITPASLEAPRSGVINRNAPSLLSN